MQTAVHSATPTVYTSHISVNTPGGSYSHGVGDPLTHTQQRRNYQRRIYHGNRNFRRPATPVNRNGYPRVKPTIPFNNEDIRHQNPINNNRWHQNNFMETPIPVLPPSPYKVDSPDPESLWPEGLFLPPIPPPQFQYNRRAGNDGEVLSDTSAVDPYLLEGSEAIAAVEKARQHGELYFHDIPHIMSLLENQELRILNNLKPHRIASIRRTWPYNRP